ncbi:MAG: hypothetical protein HRU26_07515 [Psychroserpens sp.]|nr:hypothetical protein [Psychroserpens sp.]
MIKGIVRTYHFSPHDFENLFLDDVDELGIIFWYKDAEKYQKELEPKK